MLQDVLQQLNTDHSAAVDRLLQFLAIPSISTDDSCKRHMTQAAEHVVEQLKAAGLSPEIQQTQGHPVVYASTTDPQVADPSAPRILFYGHYDVQPPDPVNAWTTPPFEPAVREGNVYARGARDDKGQISCFFEAVRAYHAAGVKLPCHVTVLIEGEEECGSINLPAFVQEHKQQLQADIIVISDSTMWGHGKGTKIGTGVPSICYAMRGMVYFDVQLHGPNRDLHSGVYGGTLANPANVLTRVLGKLMDENERITIPGFYDDLQPLGHHEKALWDKLNFDEQTFFQSVGMSQGHGESGYSTLQRRWARPACDINGLYGGYGEEGAKTVLPAMAGAKVSFRISDGQNPSKIAQAFTQWLEAQPTHGLSWKITRYACASPALMATDSQWISAASNAIKQATGLEPVMVREGGTIPLISEFRNILGIDTLMVGFGLDSDSTHSPNEHFGLDRFTQGCKTHVALLAEFGKVKN